MGAWLGNVGGLVGIIVFIGALTIYFRGSRDKATIDSLEASSRAQEIRISVLEQENASLRERVTSCEAENKTLRLDRPSADAIRALSAQLSDHDEKQDRRVAAVHRDLKKLMEGDL